MALINPGIKNRRNGIRPSPSWLMDHAKFFVRRTFSDFTPPRRPWFDQEGTVLFERLLQQSKLYIEYGAGGSTVLAADLGKTFLSVESDIRLSKTLTSQIGQSAGAHILSVDIGPTGAWGAPIFTRPNDERLQLWRNYVIAPWAQLTTDMQPDLVLIDGRFRVACSLYSLLQLRNEPTATILVDDYRYRAHFHVLEQYARLECMAGRMAVFHPSNDVATQDIQTALNHYIVDWR